MALRDVAGVLDAAVGDDRYVVVARGTGAVVNRGDLGNAYTGDDTGRADRARADAELDCVDPRIDERVDRACSGDVATDDVDVPAILDATHGLAHTTRMSVRGVDHEHIDIGRDQHLTPLERICSDSDGRGNP